MFALEEKQRTVVLLRPDFLLQESVVPENKGLGKTLADDVCAKLEEEYLEVKCRKHIYLTKQDAADYFHYLPQATLQRTVAAFARGLCVVLVLEHLDGDVIERMVEFLPKLIEEHGEGSVFCSSSPWACMRDLEFFFPHLDSLPRERTLAVIKSDGLQAGQRNKQTLEEMAEALAAEAGLIVVAKRGCELTEQQATMLCKDYEDTEGARSVLLAEHGCVAMLLEGRGAVARWQLLCGPINSGAAREVAPTSLRAIWGTDSTSNAVHASASLEAAEEEVASFFPAESLTLQRTLCIVKPDAMSNLMKIREEIVEAGFTVLIEKEVHLTEERAAEFYEAHAAEPYFNAMVREAISGPCIVATLCRLEAVSVLQQLMGPESVKDARRLRPKSLRARYGRDGQRNAVHGSTARAAPREVRFFFPELGADPAPTEAEVQDYMFRKSAAASMELKNLSETDGSLQNADQTLQQLLSQGLMALCQVQPKGLSAVKWLSKWLTENNPNKAAGAPGHDFNPEQRAKRYTETGITREGLPFYVEPPAPAKKKQIIDVDISGEAQDTRNTELTTPPFVIFAVGGPGSLVHQHCVKLKEDFSFVILDVNELMNEEVAAETYLGTEIFKHQQQGVPVPDAIQLQVLKKHMVKHQDTNRFLIEQFPSNVEQAKKFEQEIAEIAYIMHFDAKADVLRERFAQEGSGDAEGAEAFEKTLQSYEEETLPMVKYYTAIGKVRKVLAEKSADEAYMETKRYVSCRFVYLLGPPGAPLSEIADKMEGKYGYSAISLLPLLERYVESGGQDADKIQQALSKGQAVDASIACPLLVAEISRDLALGIQNFVLCDFPQSQKQAQFLEHRLPCVTKPLLLDFSRADADDLAATCKGDALQMELRSKEFFEGGYKQLFEPGPAQLPGLVRVPCSLSGVATAVGGPVSDVSREQRIIDATWSVVSKKVMPGLTIILGPPCSGTERLTNHLASMSPNTQAVDVNVMLDRELERRTETGINMHNMLARGQVVPLSTSLELLKDIVNLSGSDSIVIENLPLYVDQIEYIAKEFRIDRVFYISGTEKALNSWKERYVNDNSPTPDDTSKAARQFDERVERLSPIVSHFARIGKLERIEVNDTPKDKKLLEEIKRATVPQFAMVTGLSESLAAKQAEMLATAYGVGPAVTPALLKEWCDKKYPARTVDESLPGEVFAAMKKYADAMNFPFLVLNSYPAKQEDAAAFVEEFGAPKVTVCINQEDEAWLEEFNAAHAEDETPPGEEEAAEVLKNKREALEGTFGLFKDKSPSSTMMVQWNPEDPNLRDTILADMKQMLRPKVFAVVAPQGTSEFSAAVADAICTTKREGGRPQKYTVVDCNELVKRGGGRHTTEIEDRLCKAMVSAEAPDRIPVSLWKDLFQEAFAQSNNPMGTFLITNFPTPCSMTSNPSIADQFHILGQSANLLGTFFVKLSEVAFAKFCSQDPADWTAYQAFDERVCTQGKVQFDRHQLCEAIVDGEQGLELTVAKLATEFHGFQTKAEHNA
eukprot:TRINITY_DN123389_c0_g1_i1.p1 TRINITY_DN123389_c0_g1~~TRINITY_DN123389_c0_g1_i1.p1  ORF type:complete len:1512 (-),score=471.27 TRINITY_DN123389_c0_g1_i1:162-4697(-)